MVGPDVWTGIFCKVVGETWEKEVVEMWFLG